MGWIKLEDDTFAQEATPDPRKIVDTVGLEEVLEQKQREVTMFGKEITDLGTRKTTIEAEIVAIQALLEA